MKLTRENLHRIATNGCGFNSAQLTLLGVADLRKGWLSRLIGNEVTEDVWMRLVSLKGAKRAVQIELCPERKEVWREQNQKDRAAKSASADQSLLRSIVR